MSNITTDFITATKKIHADVRAILTHLHLIGDDVKAIKDQGAAEGDSGKTGEEHPGIRSLHPSKKNANAYGKQQCALDKLRFRLEKKAYRVGKWTVIILAIYTAFTGYQSWQSRRLLDLTRKTAEREDRAWVAVQPKGPFRIIAGEDLGFPFILVNTGKTPARRIHVDMWAKFVPTNSQEEMAETGPRLEMEGGDLFAGNINLAEFESISKIIRQRSTVPRTRETENWPIETSEVQAFGEGTIYAVGYMVVYYDDIFGVHHRTRVCAHISNPKTNPDASRCVAYNSEDDNEEP